MRTYGQYCPIARASEVLAERWTPIVLRTMLTGADTFNAIADGVPGMSRTLLTSRLRGLERAGVITIDDNSHGRGSTYHPTAAGRDLFGVLAAMGSWAEQWLELRPEHVDPGLLLHLWCTQYLAVERLPTRRVVVRFDFTDQPPPSRRLWVVFDGRESEVCRTAPGTDEDLVVTADAHALTRWHTGHLDWADAVRQGDCRGGPHAPGPRPAVVEPPRDLRHRPGRPPHPARHARLTRVPECASPVPIRDHGRTTSRRPSRCASLVRRRDHGRTR